MNNLSFASIKELKAALANKEITAENCLIIALRGLKKKIAELGSALEVFR